MKDPSAPPCVRYDDNLELSIIVILFCFSLFGSITSGSELADHGPLHINSIIFAISFGAMLSTLVVGMLTIRQRYQIDEIRKNSPD